MIRRTAFIVFVFAAIAGLVVTLWPASVLRGVGWEATPNLAEVVVLQQQVEITGQDAPFLKRQESQKR